MALSKLEEFLASRETEVIQEVKLITGGHELIFKVKSMNREEYNNYQKKAVKVDAKTGTTEVDPLLLSNLIIANHCIEPNFNNAEFLKKIGGGVPVRSIDAVSKCLKIGEADALVGIIMNISGLDSASVEILEKKAKKS